ncbi:MAG: cysteine desulfurase family protein [Pirellulaceae bacterium]|nr:cysteine desulfurase [Planctomycetales bacterium]
MDPIYLDYNATSPIHPEVVRAITDCFEQDYANPASPHTAGQRARRVLDDAREMIGQLLGARIHAHPPDRVVFTSGGTEANNLAIRGLVRQPPGTILISAIEHPSVLEAANSLRPLGYRIAFVPVDRHGVIDLPTFRLLLEQEKYVQLVSVMLGNNETGVIQPVAELARLAHQAGALFHTDAVQAAGKIHVSFADLNVDAMTVSAHKFQGPVGIAALILRQKTACAPILFGGGQQLAMRPGTESVPLAVGMRQALQIAVEHIDDASPRVRSLRNHLQHLLVQGDPTAVVHAESVERLPHTLGIAFPGVDRQALLLALDMQRVACSTGSACASGSSEPSPVLLAMGCEHAVVNSSLRFSLGPPTTIEEVDSAASRILLSVNKLRPRKS